MDVDCAFELGLGEVSGVGIWSEGMGGWMMISLFWHLDGGMRRCIFIADRFYCFFDHIIQSNF